MVSALNGGRACDGAAAQSAHDPASHRLERRMKLDDALKVSLDELRMQMLGAQVLLGFEFQGLFQDGFAAIPLVCRSVTAVGLGLMIGAIGLMVAVPCQHRIVEGGEASVRIY